jgi:hypothetical protein
MGSSEACGVPHAHICTAYCKGQNSNLTRARALDLDLTDTSTGFCFNLLQLTTKMRPDALRELDVHE